MRIDQLKANFPQTGQVDWMGVRAKRGEPIIERESVEAIIDRGLTGDKAGARPGGKRQVTLFQAEYLEILQTLIANRSLSYADFRRNLAVSGINLNALLGQTIQIGQVQLEITGLCHPCKKIEDNLGFGAFNAMRGHGGLTAKVVQSGIISMGDSVAVIATSPT